MFTSGSTGSPKGAVISHANVLNFIQWARRELLVTPDDIFTNVNPLHFDNSVFDFYASIMNGASLVPFDAKTMRDPYAVLRRTDGRWRGRRVVSRWTMRGFGVFQRAQTHPRRLPPEPLEFLLS